MKSLSIAALALAAVAPAQNLLDSKWVAGPENPQFINKLEQVGQEVSFNPLSPSGDDWTEISQQVDVRFASLFQLRLDGILQATGSNRFELYVGSQKLLSDNTELQMTATKSFSLAAGKHLVRFRTRTSNLTDDSWILRSFRLEQTFTPTVEIYGQYSEFLSQVDLKVSAKANLLAVSLHKITPPIRFPGVIHGLELAPFTLFILAQSASGDITVDLGEMMRRARLESWPRMYFQAATWNRLGPDSEVHRT